MSILGQYAGDNFCGILRREADMKKKERKDGTPQKRRQIINSDSIDMLNPQGPMAFFRIFY